MSKVLIIEDETSIAELEKDYMELSGFEVDSVADGEEGLKKALEEDYDLIVLDLMLPGMDGFDVCKQIRDDKNVPIIIVSARKEEIDKIVADYAFDTADRAEYRVYFGRFESLSEYSDKRSVYRAGGSSRLCHSYVHKFAFLSYFLNTIL